VAADAAAPGPRATAARAWLWGTAGLSAATIAVVAALAPPASAPPGRALAWLLFTGSSVHVAATGWLYTLPAVRAQVARHRFRYLWAPGGLIAATAATAAVLPPAAFGWLLLPYAGWQFFHFQKQNLGMAALAASACQVRPLSTAERRTLLLAGGAGITALLARPGLLGMQLDAGIGAAYPAAAAGFALAVAAGLVALARRPRPARPAGFTTMYLVSLLFPVPVFVFSSPYAAVGGMTVAHGLQYLVLIGLVAAAGPGGPPRPVRPALLASLALAGGAALSTASHLHGAGPGGRLLFGAYLGATMAPFVIDAGLWRMRDPFARQFLRGHLPYLMPDRPGRPAVPQGRPGSCAPAPDRSHAEIGWRP
jgi:hypothetical protein